MSSATKRSILRCFHLILSIPILGYVYSPFAELPNYAPIVRFVSVPVLILSGFWMYAGVFFAIIGVVVWLGALYLSGVGAAILSQVALFIARKIWLVIQARRRSSEVPPMRMTNDEVTGRGGLQSASFAYHL
jgi:hypothetical protein